jgi:hypothetical protein
MRVLFDQATPVPIRPHLKGHEVCRQHSKGRRENPDGLFLFGIDACNKNNATLIPGTWKKAIELY